MDIRYMNPKKRLVGTFRYDYLNQLIEAVENPKIITHPLTLLKLADMEHHSTQNNGLMSMLLTAATSSVIYNEDVQEEIKDVYRYFIRFDYHKKLYYFHGKPIYVETDKSMETESKEVQWSSNHIVVINTDDETEYGLYVCI